MKLFCATVLSCLVLPAFCQTPVWTQFPNSPAGTTRNDDMFFADQLHGWSARGTDGIYRTTNGGQAWTKVFTNGVTTPGLTAHFRTIGFASTTRGWAGNLGPGSYDGAVNNTNLLYETFDGGATWSVTPGIYPPAPPGTTNGFCALHVLDAQRVYGAGRVRGPAVFYKTENGGSSWFFTNLTDSGVMGGLMDVYFKDPTNGFIVGMNTNSYYTPPYFGSIARTTNGGLTWQVLVTTTVANSYFWKMSWPTPSVGYVSLQQNSAHNTVIYYKTTDGGVTWVSNGVPFSAIGLLATSFGLQGIGFVSTNEGWMGGSSSQGYPTNFIHTTNGGLTWTTEGYNNTKSINRIRFASPTLGYMSGQALHVYHVPLAATISPASTNAFLGANLTFTTAAYGTAPLVYQWRLNGTNLVGATTNFYSITNLVAGNAGNYDLVLSDFSGSVTSAVATLAVSGVPVPPSIAAQPQSLIANQGSNATFNVSATGTTPLRFQWFFNNANILGATNSSYTRLNVQSTNTGSYFVVVTNIAGSVTSSVAILTLGFVDDFDGYAVPVTVTNGGLTNGYKVFFTAASGPQDFKVIFGFDYSAVTFPTNIPSAPHSSGGTTKGLFLSVNKDATPSAAAVNLYPLLFSISNNYTLKFDLWLNWTNPGTATEHALFGINHSGNVTNRVSQLTSDGLFFAVDGDGNVSGTSSTVRDFAVFRGGGASVAPILMLTNNTTFGPAPLLGKNFDGADVGFASLFPAKPIPGYPTTPAGSAGFGWVSGEVRQENNLITCLLNGVAIVQYTNTFGYTNGAVMIGYNDVFDSLGSTNNFVIFDNLRVAGIVIAPVKILSPQLAGTNFSFSFATEAYASYTVQWTTNLATGGWTSYTNFIGNGSTTAVTIPLTVNLPWAQFFRVSRP